MKQIACIILLLFCRVHYAQQPSVEISYFSGSDFKLTDATDYTFNAQGLNLKYSKPCTGDKPWRQYYNLPRRGQALHFSQYSKNGYSIALHTFIEFEFLRSLKHQLYFSPSLGLAYVSETSDSKEHYRLTSLPVNFAFKMELGYRYAISPQWQLSAAYFLTHFSNGNIKSPNDGLNMKAWKAGLSYRFGEVRVNEHKPYEKPEFNRFFAQVSLGSGIKSNQNTEQSTFLNTFLKGGVNLHPFHRLIGGIDLFHSFGKTPNSQIGFNVGYQILVGKMGVVFGPGWYTSSYYNENRYYFMALQYHFHSHWFIQSYLRTTEQFYSEDLAIGLGFEI